MVDFCRLCFQFNLRRYIQEPKTTSYKAPGPGTYEAANKPRNPVAVQRSNFQSGSAR
jgi:hypothetical protein